jgi:hypothetical protein
MNSFYSSRAMFNQKTNNCLRECIECENLELKLTQPHLRSRSRSPSGNRSPTTKTTKELNAVEKLENDFQKKSTEKDMAILDLHKFRVDKM